MHREERENSVHLQVESIFEVIYSSGLHLLQIFEFVNELVLHFLRWFIVLGFCLCLRRGGGCRENFHSTKYHIWHACHFDRESILKNEDGVVSQYNAVNKYIYVSLPITS